MKTPELLSDAAVEAAAQALYIEDENDYMGDGDWPSWGSDDNVARAGYLERARAALRAAVNAATDNAEESP